MAKFVKNLVLDLQKNNEVAHYKYEFSSQQFLGRIN